MTGKDGIADTAPAWFRPVWLPALALSFLLGAPLPATALSEISPDETLSPTDGRADPKRPEIESLPLPDIVQPPVPDESTTPEGATPSTPDVSDEPDDSAMPQLPQLDPNAPLPEVIYDLARLPAPARRMRELILEATKSGDPEKLRPLIGLGDDVTQLSLGGMDGDPIEFLKGLSGDGQGQEILAILEEILEAGFVHIDPGTPVELFVWPYFFAYPLERLTPPQRVELFRIMTAGDYEDMKSYGAYIFYRIGITPEGRWSFFVAGD